MSAIKRNASLLGSFAISIAGKIAPNKLPNGDDNPEGRAKNRRTEFKVIKLK